MTEKLENLFDQIKEYGKYIRNNKPDQGGTAWGELKKILESNVRGEWNPKVKEFFVYMRSDLKIQECENEIPIKDEVERHKMWEKHHFYLQHARIPTLNFNEASLTRLLQIAYNVGQLEAVWDDKFEFYTYELKGYYNQNSLYKMETYMDNKSLIKLNDAITDDMIEKLYKILNQQVMKGGSIYKAKYIKYKNKYMSLKK